MKIKVDIPDENSIVAKTLRALSKLNAEQLKKLRAYIIKRGA